jgi:hypothetical protein
MSHSLTVECGQGTSRSHPPPLAYPVVKPSLNLWIGYRKMLLVFPCPTRRHPPNSVLTFSYRPRITEPNNLLTFSLS